MKQLLQGTKLVLAAMSFMAVLQSMEAIRTRQISALEILEARGFSLAQNDKV